MGEDPKTIFPVGSTSLDVIAGMNLDDVTTLMEAQQRMGVGAVIDLASPYLVVIQHPVTTEYEQNLAHVNETIQGMKALKMNMVWIWPNMDAGSDGISKGIRMFREREKADYVHFFKSLPIELYAPLLKNAACIVGNSSSGIRESAFMGVPAVNIGSRQSGRERCANVMDVVYDREMIQKAVRIQVEHGPYEPDFLYGDGKAGERIVKILKDFNFQIQKKISY
jgi:UDP-hydrolysing UDP-N-acetyl-D-glucosamine 2-epimerase